MQINEALMLHQQEIVCLIPTLNECYTVAEVISQAKSHTHRIVVIDGYSDDDTCQEALAAGAEVVYQEGKGKGMALRTAFSQIYGDIYVIIDGDATYHANEIGKIIQPIIENSADMVIGSRIKGKMEAGSISRLNRVGNKLFNYMINLIYKGNITDSQSGFRAMNRKVVDNLHLTAKGFEVETEITIKALKQGLKVKEIPITYSRRRGSASKLNSFRAGSRILKTIFAYM